MRPTLLLAILLLPAACDDTTTPSPDVAPSATTLSDRKRAVENATVFTIGAPGSHVDFTMEAPKEVIRGRVPQAITGTIEVDLHDLTTTAAHLYVDIGGLELFQKKAGDDGTFGEETKNATQNEHARNWLEIGDCEGADDAACEAMTKKNRNVEFVISKVETTTPDVTKLAGTSRTVKATVTGDFLLHQHKTTKTAELELTFTMDGARATKLAVKTLKPFAVGLAEHDVRPREAFGKLAQKTLDILSPKVAKEAQVSVSFEAALSGAPAASKPAASTP